ncbi:hypothetical protein CRE_19791 [Caenorhabditis remanei]|uniref:Reverse transcriptase domain-containing protein n=1 Tax=Caenorhabditis remanei TaxID=31234 RepID=E3MTB7_CAERE|nr:hypothetical protein CRE_19791 [Caenorhabditis remanei]
MPDDTQESDPEGELLSPLAKKSRGGQKRKFGAGTAKTSQTIPARLKSLESTVITLKLLIEEQRKTITEQAKTIQEIRGMTKLTGIDSNEFPPLSNSLTRKVVPKQCALYNEVAKRNPKVVEVSNRLDLVTDIIQFNKKSCTAVIENLPDSKEESQIVQDKSFISKFALDCALPKRRFLKRVLRKLGKLFRLSCVLSNIRSIATIERIAFLQNLMEHKGIHLAFLTETFLSPAIPESICNSIKFSCLRSDRSSSHPKTRGGGCALLYRSFINLVKIDLDEKNYITHFCDILVVDHTESNVRFILVYRPPDTSNIQTHNLVDQLNTLMVCPKKSYVLLGDFNLPGIQWAHHSRVDNTGLTDMTEAHNMIQLVKSATRISQHGTENILDLIFSSNPKSCFNVEVSEPLMMSDHYSVHFSTDFTKEAGSCRKVKKLLNYRKCDIDSLNAYLDGFNWAKQFSFFSTLNTKISHFLNIFNESIDMFTPLMTINSRSAVVSRQCTYKLLKRRNKSFDSKKLKSKVKSCLKRISKRIRKSENEIIGSANSRRLFGFVKRRLTSSSSITKLLVNGSLVTEPSEIADQFIKTFADNFTIPSPPHLALPHPKPKNIFVDLSPLSVFLAISKLHPKIGYSTDRINFYANSISVPLSLLFTESLSARKFPDCWKTATVIPLHKKGSTLDPSNFRPISLTHPLARLFERLILKPIKSELAAQLSKKQYGFLSNRSCPLALIDATSQYHLTLSKPKAFMDVILIDFRKAFDSVPHDLLLFKLMHFGLDSSLCDWFRSFLSNRESRVKIDDYISDNSFNNVSGVLQGTVTGPFLFLIYINDLIQSLPSDVYSIAFADDLKIYSENPASLQETLNVISDWCDQWKLQLAENKTVVLHLGVSNPHKDYFIGNAKLASANAARDLGLLVDCDLKFEAHIAKIVNSAKFNCRRILNSFRSNNIKFYFKLFNSFIRPTLEYACELFHPSNSLSTSQLESPLRIFSRQVFHRCNISFQPTSSNAHLSPFERRLEISSQMSMYHRRILLILKTYFKIVTHQCHFPNLALYVKPALSPRFPYRIVLCGKKNNSFLHKHFSTWDKIVPYFPKTVTEQTFASRLRQLPLQAIFPKI